jgi:hypothetical protein
MKKKFKRPTWTSKTWKQNQKLELVETSQEHMYKMHNQKLKLVEITFQEKLKDQNIKISYINNGVSSS